MDQLLKLNIQFKNECHFKEFIAQFQPHCSFILCIKNNDTLWCFHKKDQLPTGLTFVKQQDDQYYFVDDQKNDYCVFSRDAAETLLPYFDNKDALQPKVCARIDKQVMKTPVLIEWIGHSDDVMTIEHDGKRMTFPKSHPLLEVKTIDLFKND